MDVQGLLNIPLWIPLVVLCLSLLYIYGTFPMKTWSRLGVPGPPPLPFIGNMHQLLNPKTGIRANVTKWQKEYGKIFGVYHFRRPCLIVTDHELFKDIFVKDFNIFHDRFAIGDDNFYPKTIMGFLVLAKGSDWKRMRSIVSPTFTVGKLRLLTGHMNSTARKLATKLEEHARAGTLVPARDVFGAFIVDVIAGTGFGLDLDSLNKNDGGFYDKVKAVIKPSIKLLLAIAISGSFPFTGGIFQKFNVSIFQPEAVEYFQEYLRKVVVERKNNPGNSKQMDYFQLLLNAEMEETDDSPGEKKLTEAEIVSQGILFIIAGYETTTSALNFVSHVLANNPHVQDRLVKEIQEVIDDPETEVSYEHCQKLKYMEAVIHETLRMYPPIHELTRVAITGTELRGFTVPKNAGVYIPGYNVGRDPDLFDDPDKFNPDRFMDEDTVNPIHFLPFGMGPRQCIGMRLAMMEMKIALVHMLKKVYIADVQPKEMDLEDYTGLLVPKEQFKLTLKTI